MDYSQLSHCVHPGVVAAPSSPHTTKAQKLQKLVIPSPPAAWELFTRARNREREMENPVVESPPGPQRRTLFTSASAAQAKTDQVNVDQSSLNSKKLTNLAQMD